MYLFLRRRMNEILIFLATTLEELNFFFLFTFSLFPFQNTCPLPIKTTRNNKKQQQ